MATKEIKMPHLGESVTEAAIVQWLVKPGDSFLIKSPRKSHQILMV